MDWSKVDLPEVKPTRFQCGELSRLDHWKIVVVSKLLKKSNAAMVQTAVYTYLSQHWEEHEKRLIAEAAAQGITAEEMFQKLIKDDE
ncbi:MAG TPA: hypothetical protein V6D10_01340 [Trichocoleus sp.]